ncbi:hypothetical protein Tco_1152887 [Tanacetum coccineum]
MDLESHRRDLQLEVRRERYIRSKLMFQNLQILFKVDFDQGFEGLRLSRFLGYSRVLVVLENKWEVLALSQFKKSDLLEYKYKAIYQPSVQGELAIPRQGELTVFQAKAN